MLMLIVGFRIVELVADDVKELLLTMGRYFLSISYTPVRLSRWAYLEAE